MTTSLHTFRTELKERMLNFIWRQWCQTGVSGATRGHSTWAIDPDVLLALTTDVGRHDARMFDAVLDWLVLNGEWINVQRLATIITRDNVGNAAVAGAIASWMGEHDKSAKWRGMSRRMEEARCRPAEALFPSRSERTAANADACDPHFARYGLLRQPVAMRHTSHSVGMKEASNIFFRSRALFGIGVRADVMLYLLLNDGGHARGIAGLLAYNHMRVQCLLTSLAEAGLATMHASGRVKHYRIDRTVWQAILVGSSTPLPSWIDWRALARGLTSVWRGAWAIDMHRADDDIAVSKMKAAARAAKDDLYASGLPFAIDCDRPRAAEHFLSMLLDSLNVLLAPNSPRPKSLP